MGQIDNAIEGGFVVGNNSNASGITFTSNYETVVCKAEGSSLVLTGDQCRIYNDMPLPTNSYGKSETDNNIYNYRSDWTEEGKFLPTSNNKLITTGYKSEIFSGINYEDPRIASRFYVLGDESELVTATEYFNVDAPPVGSNEHTYEFSIYAVIDGVGSKVTKQEGEHKSTASRIVSVGEENEIDNPGKDSVLAIFGDGSTVINDEINTAKYIFSGSKQGTVKSFTEEMNTPILIANKAKSIEVSGEALILATESPERFTVGKNSVVAVGWKDGIRQRVAVFYEGQDIDAGKFYRVDENGKAVEVK